MAAAVTVHTPEKQLATARLWTALFAGCTLLALALWLVFGELLPRQSLDSRFGFAPQSVPLARFQLAYRLVAAQCALWTLVLVCAAIWLAWQRLSAKSARAMRVTQWLLCGVALVFMMMQVIAWTKSTHYARELDVSKSDIGAAFSELFCETRALQLCVQEDELDKLLIVIGGEQTTSSATASDSLKASTLAIWLRCRDLLVSSHARLSSEQLRLLSDSNATATTDAWCGRHYLSEVTDDHASDLLSSGGDAAASSPFDVNPEVFAALQREWPARYVRDTLFLGTACVFAVALSWCLATLRRDGSDGFELIDVKTGQTTSARATPAMIA